MKYVDPVICDHKIIRENGKGMFGDACVCDECGLERYPEIFDLIKPNVKRKVIKLGE